MTAAARPSRARGVWLLDVVGAAAPEVVDALPDAVFRSRRGVHGSVLRPERRLAPARAEVASSTPPSRFFP